jgi:hydroxyethylthiazole kinase-like uncharacterized protein yjeF
MRIVDRACMQEIDRRTIEEYGFSGDLLMENAGHEFVRLFLREYPVLSSSRIGILCGGGNNGGDGFVIARLLARYGFRVTVFLFVPPARLKGSALDNYRRLSWFSSLPVVDLSGGDGVDLRRSGLHACDYLIDALLGIGFHGSPRGAAGQAIAEVNRIRDVSPSIVVSVDMPSGIDADGGQGEGVTAIRAHATYTMGCLKFGLVDYPGKGFAGTLRVLDIGFPPSCVEKTAGAVSFLDSSLAACLLPPRRADSHKGTYGHLAVFGGKPGYEGASLLASRAALRTGCGLVTLLLPKESGAVKPDEVIRSDLPPGGATPRGVEKILSRYDSILIGPGMGSRDGFPDLLGSILSLGRGVVVDADGINNLAGDPGVLSGGDGHTVITPHIGEMARLSGLDKEEVKRNKRGVAQDISDRYGITVVLKDSVTVVASGGHIYINDGGVPSLSKGGSGDVLAGIIGSLMARGSSPTHAAVLGVYLHTESGRITGEKLSPDGVKAGDLIDALPDALRSLEGERPRASEPRSQYRRHPGLSAGPLFRKRNAPLP